ncbi:VWA domain-containing protein [Streptomyces sp. NPDC091292]|uniref:VWA domain-containing protein n=1 Tax=Streptomyces sp. NPDC091292 TaxID=3365991 RepID=UPI0038029F89
MSHGPSNTPSAVLYVGPPAVVDLPEAAWDVLADEARTGAFRLGLRPVGSAAKDRAVADAALASAPDAPVLVHLGRDLDRWWDETALRPRPGAVLWHLLSLGSVLWVCGEGTRTPPDGRPVARGGPTYAVTSLPGAPALPAAEAARREAHCRAYAGRYGLYYVGELSDEVGASRTHTSLTVSTFLYARRDRVGSAFLIHPDALTDELALSPEAPDALLLDWLRAGRVIRPVEGRSLMHHQEPSGYGRAIAVSGDSRVYQAGRDQEFSRPAAREVDWMSLDTRSTGSELMSRRIAASKSGRLRSSSGAGSDTPRHPARDPGVPLPHDGLFIRRNNAFGTRASLGVSELVDHGVLIDQEQIRFDDFVAARTDQVPGPGAGEAVAVSHGVASVRGGSKAKEATTHFVEIALRAAPEPPDAAPAKEPLPVNFVFVVDTSSSMHGEKLDTVKSALQAIHTRLRPDDCLGIVTFDSQVRTALKATRKADLDDAQFARIVAGLRAEGATDINLGVQYGIDEISRNARGGRTVNCLYLFSDGDPTSGERDWIRIRTNIAGRTRAGLTLSCFGFGSDARMPELAALAGIAGGQATFVTRPEQVGTHLLEDLGRRDHLAAIDIQVKIDVAADVEVWHLYGHDLITDPKQRASVRRAAAAAGTRAREEYGTAPLPDLIDEERGIRIFAPDLAFEETYWVVLEVRVPEGGDAPAPGTAVVQYVDTVAREARRHEIDLSSAGGLSPETVTVHAVGLRTSEITFHALDDLYENDRESATDRLNQHIQVLEDVQGEVAAPEFREDQVTLRKLISLAGTLGQVVTYSDSPGGGGSMSTAVRAMNTFGRVRGGFDQRF